MTGDGGRLFSISLIVGRSGGKYKKLEEGGGALGLGLGLGEGAAACGTSCWTDFVYCASGKK